MPEASSYAAQNSTDLSAATSPGSSYLISFCKSLTHWLLAFLLSRFLSLLTVSLIVFFPQRIWFSFFSGLNSTWLFISPHPHPQAFNGIQRGRTGGMAKAMSCDFSPGRNTPKTQKVALSQLLLPQSRWSQQFRGSVSLGWDFFVYFFKSSFCLIFLFFSPLLSFLSFFLSYF